MICVKKRFFALLCALVMLACFSCAVSASIMVEDPDGSIHYDTDEIVTTTQPGALAFGVQKVMTAVSGFWHRFGVVTVVVLLLVAIVVAIVISEFERQKKEKRPPQPAKKSGKKKK